MTQAIVTFTEMSLFNYQRIKNVVLINNGGYLMKHARIIFTRIFWMKYR